MVLITSSGVPSPRTIFDVGEYTIWETKLLLFLSSSIAIAFLLSSFAPLTPPRANSVGSSSKAWFTLILPAFIVPPPLLPKISSPEGVVAPSAYPAPWAAFIVSAKDFANSLVNLT